ncbi:MAG: CpaD family pilus assembly protein [Novosphingobium sp.]|jgi:pilus assembly protein CpaD
MRNLSIRTAGAAALAASMVVSLGGCAGLTAKNNNTLESIHQPVVERTNYTLDVATGSGGMSLPEQRRLSGWFDAMDLRYGDRIAIDDPLASGATRAAVEAIASRYGILLSDGAPVTPGYVNPGTARIVVTRSTASVPGCSDWSKNSENALMNETSTNFGCATNGNLAAMVANPEDLVRGSTAVGETTVMSSNKAIDAYRAAAPTGNGNTVKENATK